MAVVKEQTNPCWRSMDRLLVYASSAMMTVGPGMHGKVWAARVDAEWLPQRKGFCSYLVMWPAPHQQKWNKFAAGPIRQNLSERNRCRTESLEERTRCRTESSRNRRGKEALRELRETDDDDDDLSLIHI